MHPGLWIWLGVIVGAFSFNLWAHLTAAARQRHMERVLLEVHGMLIHATEGSPEIQEAIVARIQQAAHD